jgi:hypothetical protein
MAGSCEHGKNLLGSSKRKEFLDGLLTSEDGGCCVDLGCLERASHRILLKCVCESGPVFVSDVLQYTGR